MHPRAMYWSVRRELWENRSIYIAPLAVAAVMVFGFFITTIAALSANTVKLDSQPDKLAWRLSFGQPVTCDDDVIGAASCLNKPSQMS